jgi:tetratricopeptide (TPR) repeat protein
LRLRDTDQSTKEKKRLNQLEEAFDLHLKIEQDDKNDLLNQYHKARCLLQIGTWYLMSSNIQRSLGYFEEALHIAHVLENSSLEAVANDRISIFYRRRYDYSTALLYSTRAVELTEIEHNQVLYHTVLNPIALIQMQRGQLEQAKINFERMIRFWSSRSKLRSAILLENLAKVYYMERQYVKARELITRAIKFQEDFSRGFQLCRLYSYRVDINLILGDREMAIRDLEHAQTQVDDTDEVAKWYSDWAKALYLKSSPRGSDKYKAQDLLYYLVDNNEFMSIDLINAIIHLIELLIVEYQTYGEAVVLQEINSYTERMYKIGKEQHLAPVLINILLLKSRLSIVQSEFENAIATIDEAIKTAEKTENAEFISRVESERKKFYQELNELKEVMGNSSIYERIRNTALIDYIRKARGLYEDNE